MSNRVFGSLLLAALGVYLLGMRVDVMEVDAAQYAEMSWEMLTTGNYLQVYNCGKPYLDKPPLLFWLNALSFFLFGISNFSYKLPSLLFALLAIYATYRMAKHFYDEPVARLSAVLLATTQALFLMTNDVRTDTMLTGAVVFAVWQWVLYFEEGKWENLLLGSAGVALALLAKGPIGLIAAGAALLPHLILKKQWKQIFDAKLFVAGFVIAIFLLPMSIGLYQQWGIKGLRFYFWTQSFGRITGESEWNNNPDTFFLLHTTAWAIAPWTIFLLIGWVSGLYNLIKMRFVSWSRKEFVTVSGFTIVLLLLSLSRYQLSHYVYVLLPFAAVIAAQCIYDRYYRNEKKTACTWIQTLVCIALLAIAAALYYSLTAGNALALGVLVACCAATVFAFIKFRDIILTSATTAIGFNLLLSAFYFPSILKYQPGNDFGRYVREHITKGSRLVMYHTVSDFSTAFYARQIEIPVIWTKEDFSQKLKEYSELFVIAAPYGLQQLNEENIGYEIIEERLAYPVSRLSYRFLNPATRKEACSTVYLLKVKS
ncbi:MAG: glycosyltransferase family 39 protein [Chitinophagales bacterium]|nr:glycosyltransferase family 39 protein [Chitinophagales bacterium]